MRSSTNKYLPEGVKEVYQPRGGLYFWLKLPDNYKSKNLYLKAGERGVAFLPGNLFLANRENTPYFRLSFAAVEQEEIETGIRNLAAVCRDLLEDEKEKGYTPLV
jgi:DNA-binding transcriptional MocR family regulator